MLPEEMPGVVGPWPEVLRGCRATVKCVGWALFLLFASMGFQPFPILIQYLLLIKLFFNTSGILLLQGEGDVYATLRDFLSHGNFD